MRRSSRIATQNIAVVVSKESSDHDDDDEKTFSPTYESDDDDFDRDHRPRPAKRRKLSDPNTTSAAPRKKGRLSALLTMMPNEVVSVICSSLTPGDLLHLVQSSKIFALFLLAPASAAIWRVSRQQLDDGFPDCPDDLTEQKYACLAFGSACQRCGTSGSRASSAVWKLQRRWCEKCRTIISDQGDSNYCVPPASVRNLVHMGAFKNKRRQYCLASTTDEVNTMTKLSEELHDKPEALKSLCDNRAREIMKRHKHAEELDFWFAKRADERAEELFELRSQRVDGLKDILVQQGFDRQLLDSIPIATYRYLPTMKQSRKFTQKDWTSVGSRILPAITRAVDDIVRTAQDRAGGRFMKLYRNMCDQIQPTTDFLPRGSTIYRIPEVKSQVDDWAKSPQNVASLLWSHPHFELPHELQELLHKTMSKVQEEVESYFAHALPSRKRLAATMTTASMLNLATSVFMSKTPNVPGNYTCMPFHILHRMQKYLPYGTSQQSLEQYWIYDKISGHIMKDIVSLCGLNPNTCTHAQLVEAEPYVVCLTCTSRSKPPTMKWDQADRHWRNAHKDMHESGSAWRILGANEKESFLPIWESYRPMVFVCLLCNDTGLELNALPEEAFRKHLMHTHSIHEAELSKPQYRAQSRPTMDLEPVEWAPSIA